MTASDDDPPVPAKPAVTTTWTASEHDLDSVPAAEAGAVGEPLRAVGRYQILERVGAGGMGVVYRARDPALDRDLAIKVVHARAVGPAAQLRLLREAQAMARLRSPGVVPVFDVGTVGDDVFVVMPYLAGGTLGAWLRAAPRRWRDVLDRFAAAGRGLAVAHAAGLVHRDFKPDNVLLDEHGELAVADFGIAIAESEAAATTGVAGTPAYMAPEQLRGAAVDARADIFSFCVSLYQGLYGERPFDAPVAHGAAAVAAHLDAIVARRLRPPPPGRDVPAWLRAAVVRGLAADPAERWPSMDALLAHLAARRRRRRRVLVAIGASIGVAIAALAVVLTTRARPDAPAPPPRFDEHVLTQRGDVQAATLALDGRHLAMITAGGELIVTDLDGSEERVLATDAWASALAWSSDARRLVYMQRRDATYQLRLVDVATGAGSSLPSFGGDAAFAGPDLLITWGNDRKELVLRDLAHPGAAPRTCAVPGTYAWIQAVTPLPDGTLFIGILDSFTARSTKGHTVRTDLACTRFDVVGGGAQLYGPIATARGLVAEDSTDRLVRIDRDGVVAPLPSQVPERQSTLVGVRADDTALFLETDARWRLVRAGPHHAPVELTAGALDVSIAVAPGGDRFALSGLDAPLRIIDLAVPAQRPAPIEPRVASVAWLPDGRLATIIRRGDALVLVIEDERGHHLSERTITRAFTSPELVWLGDETIGYVREDATTYVAIDLRTGATRELFDPVLGHTSALARSPRDGALALAWNRPPGMGVYVVRPGQPAARLPVPLDAEPVWTADGDALYLLSSQPPRVDRFDLATQTMTPYLTDLGSPRSTIVSATPAAGGDLFVHLAEHTSDVYAESLAR